MDVRPGVALHGMSIGDRWCSRSSVTTPLGGGEAGWGVPPGGCGRWGVGSRGQSDLRGSGHTVVTRQIG